jgi:glycosyltransferase involved in cell wall biosynthesis
MNIKVKVLHIIKSLGRGGAEMLLPETLRLHDHSQFEFHYIYFLPWKDQMADSLKHEGGRVACLPSANNIELILKARGIVRYIKQNNIQLIHAHLPWAGIVARMVGKMTGVPVMYTEHNKQERYHYATRWLNLATMNWLTRLIAVSKDVEGSIRKFKPSLTAHLQTIFNGVNTKHFAPGVFNGSQVRKSLNIPVEAPVIGTVAVFRSQKRLAEWMNIAASVIKEIPNAHFIIVGDGPLKNDLYETRKRLKLEPCIHFAGLQTEVRPYLAAFDIYMMSSVFEGLPVALLEAMSMGIPVISTDAGGIKEVVRHNEEGLLLEVDQWPQLAGCVVTLVNDGERRKKFGTAARKRCEEAFSMERMVKALEETYTQLSGTTA